VVASESLLITNGYVREALDQLIQATANNTVNPLQHLHLIDSNMLISDFSFFQNPRKFALNDLLVSTIRTEYLRQRYLHAFAPVEMEIPLLGATNAISEDATTGNSDLIGWSWVYFHYVEMNLRITQQQFCHWVRLDDRTIRRYQNNTIDQLTKYLVRMEQNARESRRRQILYFQLPHQGNTTNLLEREKEMQLIRRSTNRHYHIVGVAGIGKTVFVERILKEEIDNDEFDHLIWFYSPDSIDIITAYMRERLLNEDTKITLAEYVSLKKITIVIDNAEKLQADPVQLQDFLQTFSNANIFLTSRLFQPIPNCLQIYLHEISFPAIQIILSRGKTNDELGLEAVDYAHIIWQSVGGNPLAIQLMTQNWPIFGLQKATALTIDQLFSKIFDIMTNSERFAWLILAFLNDNYVTFPDLSEFNSSYVASADFITLGRLFVSNVSIPKNDSVTLTISSERFIRMRYEVDMDLQNLLNLFISDEILGNGRNSKVKIILVESILSADWRNIDSNNELELVKQFWRVGIRQGHYTKWHVILGKIINDLNPQNIDLAIGYGISQKYLGRWTDAHSIFTSVIHYAGMHALFSYQAEALLELAILLRYQGDYASAIASLNHVNNFPKAVTTHLGYRVLTERIEIALESNNLDDAKSLFTVLPDDEIYKHFLQLEIYAKDVDYDTSFTFLTLLYDKLLRDFSYSPTLTARIHILLGRIYEKRAETKIAIKHLTIAQSILIDIDNDPFALARTQTNLAALFINSNQLIDAQELLRSAENIQRKIGDRVGIAVTMHNEYVLDRKIVD
jgi:tetratricopeptide (TPR) repeat protein